MESKAGLYYSDMRENDAHDNIFANIVSHNKYIYDSRNYLQAVLARKTQKIIGGVRFRQFNNIVSDNEFRNRPHLKSDIDTAEDVFGPSIKIM